MSTRDWTVSRSRALTWLSFSTLKGEKKENNDYWLSWPRWDRLDSMTQKIVKSKKLMERNGWPFGSLSLSLSRSTDRVESSSNDVIPSTTNPLTSSPLEEEERKRKRKLDNSIQSEEEEEEGKESHKEMAIVIL